MKRLAVYLLCVSVCMGMLLGVAPVASAEAAEPETEATVVEQLQLTEGGAAGTPVHVKGETHWNTLLGEAPKQTVGEQNQWLGAASEKGYIFYDNTPTEDVLAHICEQMQLRKTTFSVTYQTKETYDYNAFAEGLFLSALTHTGDGKGGDYLTWCMRDWSGELQGYERQYITYTYTVHYLTTAAQEKQMDTAVADLLKSLNLGGCTDYQKVKKIYDWMCNNITYDHTGFQQGIERSPLSFTAYKGLTQGTCVCQGYATLFYRLALECGIDARVIAGNPKAPHGWNIVKLGGYYYNLDSTWDAEYAQVNQPYRYFLRSPANFSADHTRYDEYNSAEFHSYYPMSPKDYTPGAPVAGDMDGDERLSTDDAVYLLLNVMFGSGDYAVSASVRRDTNGDGKVTTDDAVYLLLHVMFGPEDYPLAA